MKSNPILGLGVSVLAASVASSALAATTDSVNRQIRGLNDRLSAYENRFRVNGFATLGLTQSDEELAYNDINNETNFRRNTKAGVQMTFNLDEQSSVITQFVSRGTNDFETKMEWAYFKHQFTHNLSSKIGRIRSPLYMLSEYIDVGYAVPWATMPQETYQTMDVFSNMDGADLSYSMEVGDLLAGVQFAYGRIDSDLIDLDDVMSIGFTLAGDAWQTRLAYSQANTTSRVGGVALYGDDTPVKGSFSSLGFTYDPGSIYLAAESTLLTVDGSLPDASATYATVGYRFGRWMPHLTYAMNESTDDDDRSLETAVDNAAPGLTPAQLAAADPAGFTTLATNVSGYQATFNRKTTRIGLGARWDYTSGVAIKFQYDMITVDDAAGLFGSTPADAAAYASAADDAPDSTNIFSISIDTVF